MNILCKIIGHKYKLLLRINRDIRELECSRCKKHFAMNDELKVVLPLDQELKELHKTLIK
jgi:hypothetical protein